MLNSKCTKTTKLHSNEIQTFCPYCTSNSHMQNGSGKAFYIHQHVVLIIWQYAIVFIPFETAVHFKVIFQDLKCLFGHKLATRYYWRNKLQQLLKCYAIITKKNKIKK